MLCPRGLDGSHSGPPKPQRNYIIIILSHQEGTWKSNVNQLKKKKKTFCGQNIHIKGMSISVNTVSKLISTLLMINYVLKCMQIIFVVARGVSEAQAVKAPPSFKKGAESRSVHYCDNVTLLQRTFSQSPFEQGYLLYWWLQFEILAWSYWCYCWRVFIFYHLESFMQQICPSLFLSVFLLYKSQIPMVPGVKKVWRTKMCKSAYIFTGKQHKKCWNATVFLELLMYSINVWNTPFKILWYSRNSRTRRNPEKLICI